MCGILQHYVMCRLIDITLCDKQPPGLERQSISEIDVETTAIRTRLRHQTRASIWRAQSLLCAM